MTSSLSMLKKKVSFLERLHQELEQRNEDVDSHAGFIL